jgi:hypothetical protein
MKKILIALALCLVVVGLMAAPVLAATQKVPMYTYGNPAYPRPGCYATFITNQGDNTLTILATVKGALPKAKYEVLLVVDGYSYSFGNITTSSKGTWGGQNQQSEFEKVLPAGTYNVTLGLLNPSDVIAPPT